MDFALEAPEQPAADPRQGARVAASSRICFAVSVVVLLVLTGCASTIDKSPQGSRSSNTGDVEPVYSEQTAGVHPAGFHSTGSANNHDRLTHLSQTRRNDASKPDYPIGPGDVLLINVAGVDELNNRSIRVTGDGFILLPLVGSVHAAGLTEQGLTDVLSKKLATYVRQPEINLFVQEYRSRSVGVFGAVAKPGVYNLTGGADTVSDMLSLAGGMTPDAARRLELLPAKPGPHGGAEVSPDAGSLVSTPQQETISRADDAVLIDLNDPTNQEYLGLPARPGDTIIVPANGQVLVEGWVEKPGSYKITPQLRSLGAIAAAGGLSFPADSTAVTLIRSSRQGDPIRISVDVDKVKRGVSEDIPVQEGDVVEVNSSTAKLVPYGVYQAFVQIFHLGAYLSPASF